MLGSQEASKVEGVGDPAVDTVTAFNFLCSAIIWLDVTASVSTGHAPQLLSIHSHALSVTSRVNLETSMACQNWAVASFGRIAALYEHKSCMLQDGHQGGKEEDEYKRITYDIGQELYGALADNCLGNLHISHSNLSASHSQSFNAERLITRIFGLAALIYLALVVKDMGANTVTAAKEVMALLQTLPAELMHAVILPRTYCLSCVVPYSWALSAFPYACGFGCI